MTRFGDLAAQLDAVGADLDDLSLSILQDAAAGGATRRPAADRTLVRARRAVERAAGLLRQLDADASTGPTGPT